MQANQGTPAATVCCDIYDRLVARQMQSRSGS